GHLKTENVFGGIGNHDGEGLRNTGCISQPAWKVDRHVSPTDVHGAHAIAVVAHRVGAGGIARRASVPGIRTRRMGVDQRRHAERDSYRDRYELGPDRHLRVLSRLAKHASAFFAAVLSGNLFSPSTGSQ